MQSINQPQKILVPFAQNDSAKVEIPVTTTSPGRFSQTLGSPPETALPPESGGTPPQLPDFNGAMNQQSRLAWWMMAGGRFAFDATWANNTYVNGYPRGAVLPAAIGAGLIGMGEWYNNAEANTADPDVNGAGWVPGYHYGVTALTGQTGGTLTLSPALAAKRTLTIAGTLTSNLVVVLPTWVYTWRIVNNTGGAYTVTVKNAATTGVVIPQNGVSTTVHCDGTQVSFDSPNIPAAVLSTQPMQLGQATGRLLAVRRFAVAGATTYTPTTGTNTVIVEVVGAGASGAGTVAALSGQAAAGGGGGGGAYAKARIVSGFAGVTITVGAPGVSAAPGNAGQAGGASSFGSLVVCPGGAGVPQGQGSSSANYSAPGLGAAAPTFGGSADVIMAASGAAGSPGLLFSSSIVISGNGANTPYGSGGGGAGSSTAGQTGTGLSAGGQGSGGGGGFSTSGGSPGSGGSGGGGLVLVWEYA
ncbi:hypothetical protein [Xanthomonas phage XPV2]|nr:hypothetical protein [Xanthomonas phage XPV2]